LGSERGYYYWYPFLNRAIEVSSMGIRIDEESQLKQLKFAGCEDRKYLPFHKDLLEGRLPYSIGGGIGQSRICMFLLKVAHIGEVQVPVWSDEMIAASEKAGIRLL